MPEHVRVNGVDLAYDTRGSGAPLLLCHGFTGATTDWDGVVPDLARARRVITFDHRGHGGSTNTGDADTYRFEQLVDDLEALVEALQLGSLDLLGHSMGGIVALRYALRRPAALRSLLLMDTGAAPAPGLARYLQVGIDIVRERGTLGLFEMRAGAYDDDPAGRRAAAIDKRKLEQMDPVAFQMLGAELGDHTSIADRLDGIDRPTTVIVGADDVAFLTPSKDLAAAIPGAVLEIIPSAAHSPQIENRSAWLEAVERHFERLAP